MVMGTNIRPGKALLLRDANTNLRFVPVGLPEQHPKDELTPEFEAALTEAKIDDAEYLQAVKDLGPRPRKSQRFKVERDLRDRLRTRIGMSPWTPTRSVVDQARTLGLNPSYDLPFDVENLSERHTDNCIQTLFFPDDMEAKLRGIHDSARVLMQDAGIKALYCAFGFLEWFESPQSTDAYHAPLLFFPVEISRELIEGVYTYSVCGRDEDISVNITLVELLRQDFGLEIPEWDEDTTLSSFWHAVTNLCHMRDIRWQVKRWVTVGLYTFARLAMYQDLSPKNWPSDKQPRNHNVLLDLFAGRERQDGIEFAEDYEIDTPEIERSVPILVTDADASQHSAVVDAMSGRNLVIQGPPGTGKSQTITNIIAAALKANKAVLFIAEKMAALEVVKNRLDSFGLGHFCLEVHSNKARKTEILESLKQRIAFKGTTLDDARIGGARMALKQARDELTRYVGRMNDKVGDTGLTVHQILWGASIRQSKLQGLPGPVASARLKNPLALDEFARGDALRLATAIEGAAESLTPWGVSPEHPRRGVSNYALTQFDCGEVVDLLGNWRDSLVALQTAVAEICTAFLWPPISTMAAVRHRSSFWR